MVTTNSKTIQEDFLKTGLFLTGKKFYNMEYIIRFADAYITRFVYNIIRNKL